MKILEAIGRKTGEVYMTASSKSHLMGKLQKKYPTLDYSFRDKTGVENNPIYPEPLIIRRKRNE